MACRPGSPELSKSYWDMASTTIHMYTDIQSCTVSDAAFVAGADQTEHSVKGRAAEPCLHRV